MIALAYLAFFGTTMVLSLGLTWYVRNLAIRKGWIAKHHNQRSIHLQEIPRLGGVAIFVAYSSSVSMLIFGYLLIGRNPEFLINTIRMIMPAATLIFLLGLMDDLIDLKAWVKFLIQVIAAFWLYYNGLQINALTLLTNFGVQELGPAVSITMTVLWVVGITNAFNLIDGLDGLAAGSALFSTSAVFIVALLGGSTGIALLTIGLMAAIIGFLRFNFNPASIFLGDSGSLFLGFMLSAIALLGMQKSPTLVAVALPVVACGLPILDTGLAIIRRMLGGKPIFGSDRDHIHHKLLDRGLSQRQVVILLYGVSALCAFLSLFLLRPGGGPIGVVIAVMAVGVFMGLKQLDYRELNELKRLARRTVDQKVIIANNIAVHHACEQLPHARTLTEITGILDRLFVNNAFDSFELSVPETGTRHCWPAADSSTEGEGWRMVIPLFSNDSKLIGSMVLYRAYSVHPLLVDINLFTSDFPALLAIAIGKAQTATTDVELASARY